MHGHFPGIIVFEMTHLAGVGADKCFWLRGYCLDVDGLLPAASRQDQYGQTQDENCRQTFCLHVCLLGCGRIEKINGH